MHLRELKTYIKLAQLFAKKGQKQVKLRREAIQAIQNKPSMGKAYLLIAGLYASSVNCLWYKRV